MSLFLYNIFLIIYKLGILVVSPWNTKAQLWIRGRKNIFRHLEKTLASEKRPMIWMHCASLGEFEQGRPVLESLKEINPGSAILLTFFSASGFESTKTYTTADYIYYLPTENRRNAERFIELVNPKLVLWVKYEYWYYFLKAIKQKEIPLLLISGIFRPHQGFFKWYNRIYLEMLNCFSHLFVQDEMSLQLLSTIGHHQNASVSGDTRFDRVVDIAGNFEPIAAIESFCGKATVIVAGSTWLEDEEELDHFANTRAEIKFIIAPHEIDGAHLQEIQKMFTRNILYSDYERKLSNATPLPGDDPYHTANVLIIDNIGMLSRLYKYGKITFVGGGFGDGGVHNVLEAAVYGKPVIFGPVYDKYIEAVELVEEGGAITVATALELERLLDHLLKDEAAHTVASVMSRNYVLSKRGATEKITQYIESNRLLSD